MVLLFSAAATDDEKETAMLIQLTLQDWTK